MNQFWFLKVCESILILINYDYTVCDTTVCTYKVSNPIINFMIQEMTKNTKCLIPS